MSVKYLQVGCSKCKVANFCPRSGSSPLRTPEGVPEFCKVLGGYGRVPINPAILSPETLTIAPEGSCLTLVYIPTVDKETGQVVMELTKIFAPPVLHDREKIPWNIGEMYPKSHKT